MHLNKAHRLVLSSSLSVFMVGCGSPNYAPSDMHITIEQADASVPVDSDSIPSLVQATSTSPSLGSEKEQDTYDVVVANTPVRDLLFVLARDSGANMDVDASVGGIVSMNALDETLDGILERIAAQVPIRVDKIGDAYVIKNDEPYYKRYHVDYTPVTRTYTSAASTGGIGGGDAGISNTAANEFWDSFEDSIAVILDVALEAGDASGATVGQPAQVEEIDASQARFTSNNEFDFNTDTGLLLVYAPDRLQKEVEQYLLETTSIVRRQVLLEATVVEVVLSNQYQQGIDWSAFNQFARKGLDFYQGTNVGGAAAVINEIFETVTSTTTQYFNFQSQGVLLNDGGYRNFINSGVPAGAKEVSRDITIEPDRNSLGEIVGFTVTRELGISQPNEKLNIERAGGLIPTTPSVPGAAFTAAYRRGDVSAAVQLLNNFGDAKVLSSPRISVLNNQPALLRVVDQEVYFNIEVNEAINPDTGAVTSRTYDVSENTVDVGFAMNVLPHITGGEEVYLNLKPSVTRVLDYRLAPVPPALGGGTSGSVQNFVPITRVREMESVMSLRNGEIAVMGGLLEDRIGDNNRSVPGLSKLPGIGGLFENINEQTFKTEFVVFIKARVISNPSIQADYSDYRSLLPDSDFIFRDRANNGLPPRQVNPR